MVGIEVQVLTVESAVWFVEMSGRGKRLFLYPSYTLHKATSCGLQCLSSLPRIFYANPLSYIPHRRTIIAPTVTSPPIALSPLNSEDRMWWVRSGRTQAFV
jgi:hypothetical protein